MFDYIKQTLNKCNPHLFNLSDKYGKKFGMQF